MKTHARVIHGKIRFASDLAEAKFMEKAANKDLIITIDDEASANKRKFFEGAIVPAVYYQNPNSGWTNFKEVREALKLEFLAGWTRTAAGERIKYAKSTTELSNAGFGRFIESIIRWMEEQGMEVPDPKEYKDWRDSAPPAGEIFPQLARLKKIYDSR